jgi:hypothetical protein
MTSSVIALDWNPQGFRKKCRPKRTWRWTLEDGIRNTGRSWNEFKGIAGNSNAWKLFREDHGMRSRG